MGSIEETEEYLALLEERNRVLAALEEMVEALEAITYTGLCDEESIYIGRHGDSDCTDDVKPALDRAKKLLGR